MQVAELEAQAAAEPALVSEKEGQGQSLEQLEALVQTKDQVGDEGSLGQPLPGSGRGAAGGCVLVGGKVSGRVLAGGGAGGHVLWQVERLLLTGMATVEGASPSFLFFLGDPDPEEPDWGAA